MTDNTDTITELIENPTIAITDAGGCIVSRVIVEMQETRPECELIALNDQYRGHVDSVGDM